MLDRFFAVEGDAYASDGHVPSIRHAALARNELQDFKITRNAQQILSSLAVHKATDARGLSNEIPEISCCCHRGLWLPSVSTESAQYFPRVLPYLYTGRQAAFYPVFKEAPDHI